jgi:hypothetical protein
MRLLLTQSRDLLVHACSIILNDSCLRPGRFGSSSCMRSSRSCQGQPQWVDPERSQNAEAVTRVVYLAPNGRFQGRGCRLRRCSSGDSTWSRTDEGCLLADRPQPLHSRGRHAARHVKRLEARRRRRRRRLTVPPSPAVHGRARLTCRLDRRMPQATASRPTRYSAEVWGSGTGVNRKAWVCPSGLVPQPTI